MAHEIWTDLSSYQNSYLNDMVLHIDLKSVEQKGSMWIMTLTELAKNMKGIKKKIKKKQPQNKINTEWYVTINNRCHVYDILQFHCSYKCNMNETMTYNQ